jgi:hypothetical protein
MFTDNLRVYVFRRNARRLRDDRISLIIAFVFSVLMVSLGYSERTAAITGLLVLGISMLSLTIYFCGNAAQISASLRRVSTPRHEILYRPISRRLASVSALLLFALFSLPEIEAAVLDRRLRKLIQPVPLDKGSIETIDRTLQEANKYGVRISARNLSDVQAALRKTADISPLLSRETIRVASAAASTTTIDVGLPPDMRGPMFDHLPEANGSAWLLIPIATNTGPDSYSTIGLAREPDVTKMEPLNNPAPPVSTYGPAFLVVKGMTATLDGWRLKHVVFQDMKLIYNGGPLLLESVYFVRCEFECSVNDNAWEFIGAVTKGGWVRLSIRR